MKPEELRIGNYAVIHDADVDLIFQHQRIRITSIEKELIGTEYESIKGNKINAKEDIDLIHPIPLTEDWLIKFDFEKSDLDLENILSWSNGSIALNTYNTTKVDYYWLRYYQNMETPQIKYVHQLQNLYQALTDKELEIQTVEAWYT